MAIEFHCPHCSHFLVTDDEKAGRAAKCPGCGDRIEIPGPPEESLPNQVEEVEATSGADVRPCPVCGKEIKQAAVKCRFCRSSFETVGAPERFDETVAGHPTRQIATDLVKTPAVSLMVMTGIMMALQVVVFLINGAQVLAGGGQGDDTTILFGLISGAIGLVAGGVIMYGCRKMMSLENYRLSMVACVLSMVPCFSTCLCLGLPLGIWGVVVLMKPEVKSAFVS